MKETLSPALWLERPGMEKLLRVLGADNLRLVGGAVRDWLLGEDVADIDLATPMRPETVVARLEAAGIRAIPTGISHGTITAVSHDHHYEVTTLRHDVETDGRHAQVTFTENWQADAARRDFTINALYAHPETGMVEDWFGGLADLRARRVRFIGDPVVRIAEDHLRILRFFRFSARFGHALDGAGLAACTARARDLMSLSRERIRDELLKLLALPDPSTTVEAMVQHGILAPVFPEIADIAALRAVIAAEGAAAVPPAPARRLAALLPREPTVAADVATRLRLSNAEKARLKQAADPAPVPADPRALAYRIGGDATLDRLLLTADPRATHWAGQLAAYTPPRLPISGKDLIAMGLPPGPAVSRRLMEVEQSWIDAGFPPGRDLALAIARTILGVK